MELPARDVRFLKERGYDWNVASDGGGVYLVVKKFGVTGGGFAPAETDLMIRIPPQYPITPLDMWYCHPTIRHAATGQFAPASQVLEAHLGKTWQRFSRHLNGTWKPGMDGLRSFFVLIQRELQGLGRS